MPAKQVRVGTIDPGWTGVGGLAGQALLRLEHLVNLPMQPFGQMIRVPQIEEILSNRVFQRDSPQVQQRLVDEEKAPVTVRDIGEVADGCQCDGENSLPPFGPL